MNSIISDERVIKMLVIAGNPEPITSEFFEIKPYHENGEMANVVWFEIISQGNTIMRVNGKYVESISYA